MSANDLISPLLEVGELLEKPGSTKAVTGSIAMPENLEFPLIDLSETIEVDLQAESLLEGILVRGALEWDYDAKCVTCLTDLGTMHASDQVVELFAPYNKTSEDEEEVDPGYTISADGILSLDILLRDSVAENTDVHLTCREDCLGLCPSCGINRNEQTCDCSNEKIDLRWQVLADFKPENN